MSVDFDSISIQLSEGPESSNDGEPQEANNMTEEDAAESNRTNRALIVNPEPVPVDHRKDENAVGRSVDLVSCKFCLMWTTCGGP